MPPTLLEIRLSSGLIIMRIAACILLVFVGIAAGGCSSLHHTRAAPAPEGASPPVALTFSENHDLAPVPVLEFLPPVSTELHQPVLLLHELPGLPREFLEFAQRLANSGFTVYAPALLGPAYSDRPMLNSFRLSFGGDWPAVWKVDRSPAVLPMLRELVSTIASRHPGRRIGVIGMCMTGSLPLALLADERTAIAALCHPALPFTKPGFLDTPARRPKLGLAAVDLDRGVKRINARSIPVLGFRFAKDSISPQEKFDTVRGLIGDNFKPHVLTSPNLDAHSVFGGCFHDTPEPAEKLAVLTSAFRTALSPPLAPIP